MMCECLNQQISSTALIHRRGIDGVLRILLILRFFFIDKA